MTTQQADVPFLGITFENCSFENMPPEEGDRLTDVLIENSGDPVRKAWRELNLALDFWEDQPRGQRNDTAYFAAYHHFQVLAMRDTVLRQKLQAPAPIDITPSETVSSRRPPHPPETSTH